MPNESIGATLRHFSARQHECAIRAWPAHALLDRHAQVLPLLAPFLGRGRVGNFLVRNKWRSYESIQRCKHLPILLLSSLQARAGRPSICCGCMAKRHELVLDIPCVGVYASPALHFELLGIILQTAQ